MSENVFTKSNMINQALLSEARVASHETDGIVCVKRPHCVIGGTDVSRHTNTVERPTKIIKILSRVGKKNKIASCCQLTDHLESPIIEVRSTQADEARKHSTTVRWIHVCVFNTPIGITPFVFESDDCPCRQMRPLTKPQSIRVEAIVFHHHFYVKTNRINP